MVPGLLFLRDRAGPLLPRLSDGIGGFGLHKDGPLQRRSLQALDQGQEPQAPYPGAGLERGLANIGRLPKPP